jgi:amylosucrase
VELALDRIAMLTSVALAIGGIPLLYLGDELATLNDTATPPTPPRPRQPLAPPPRARPAAHAAAPDQHHRWPPLTKLIT